MTPERVEPPAFCCPRCTGSLKERAEPPAYVCGTCDRSYPIVLGIPDFRLWPDPYIAADKDWAKGARVRQEASHGGFRAMVEHYWRLTPDVPARMAARFIRYALVGAARGRTRVDQVVQARGELLGPNDRLLDLGCGSGGLLVAAGQRAGAVVGVDIAARWLVIARQQCAEAGLDNALLACACAEHLPFRDGVFDVVVANDVLEHSQSQQQLLREARRVLRGDGLLLLTTQNRWSLRGEPHVGVWGAGFLPRRWMARYIHLVRGVPYRFIRLVSLPELDRLLRAAGLRVSRRMVPRVSRAELAGLGKSERRMVALYDLAARARLLRPLLLWLGPSLEVAARPTPQLEPAHRPNFESRSVCSEPEPLAVQHFRSPV